MFLLVTYKKKRLKMFQKSTTDCSVEDFYHFIQFYSNVQLNTMSNMTHKARKISYIIKSINILFFFFLNLIRYFITLSYKH